MTFNLSSQSLGCKEVEVAGKVEVRVDYEGAIEENTRRGGNR
jgi:hypothetical protein